MFTVSVLLRNPSCIHLKKEKYFRDFLFYMFSSRLATIFAHKNAKYFFPPFPNKLKNAFFKKQNLALSNKQERVP